MNGTWITTLSVALVILAVLAEVNLLRIFINDWREDRRGARAKPFQQRLDEPAAESRPSRWRVTSRGLAACIAAPMTVGSVAQAQAPQTDAPPAHTDDSATLPESLTSPLSLQLNFDATTAYFYHGIIQEDTGPILQPAAKLTVNVYEQDDLKIDAIAGVWNSFHGQKTAAQTHGDFTEYWYECDLIGGVVVTKGKVSLTGTYTILTSPSDAYETVQELDFTLAYDDSDQLGKFALHPYALLGIETGADASDGANSDAGTYLELGVAPGLSVDVGQTPVAISFPASVGLSLNDYYQNAAGDDDTFGFAQVGAKAAIPLPFGDRYGTWTLNAGVSALFLGDNTSEYNGGQDQQVIGTIGVQANF